MGILRVLIPQNKRPYVCLFLKKVLRIVNDSICFSKEDLEEINTMVNDTQKKAEKFQNLEPKIPALFEAVNGLKESNVFLTQKVKFYEIVLNELFDAEISNNEEKKIKIFKELGFEYKNINN